MNPTNGTWAHRGLWITAILLATLLVGTAGWNYVGISRWTHDLAETEGELLLRAAHHHRFLAPAEDDKQMMQAFLEAFADQGLVWAGTVDPETERVLYQAGTSVSPETLPIHGPRIRFTASTVQIRQPIGPPPPPGRRPPPKGARGKAPPTGPPPGPPPRGKAPPPFGGPDQPILMLEFTPLAALDLQRRARNALFMAIGGALVLLFAAGHFQRQTRQSEVRQRALDKHQHLASLGQVAAVLAHEIRNPLAALKGHAQLLTELLEGQPTQKRSQVVVDQAIRLQQLTDHLLDFARTADLKLRETSIEHLAQRCIDSFEGRINLDLERAPSHWKLDEERVQQVLINLLDNALKSCHDAVDFSVAVAGDQVFFQVRDRGMGVPTTDRDLIFQPFHTDRTEGTGLGLAVARRIITLHGGRITVDNHPDGGAVFTVQLPRT